MVVSSVSKKRQLLLTMVMAIFHHPISATNSSIYHPYYDEIECKSCPGVDDLIDPQGPLAIIGGSMKGGTRALLTYLSQHPLVYSRQGRESHLFDNGHVEIFSGSHKYECDRCEVLRTYNKMFDKKRRMQRKGEEDLAFFDKSPSYLAKSQLIPQRILCALPKAKVIFILRNPVERTYSHFNHCAHKTKHGPRCKGLTFEEWIDRDMAVLEAAGVLRASNPAEEYEAWRQYRLITGMGKTMGIYKSLYSVALRQWIAVFRDHFGEDRLLDHLLILESEYMHVNKQEVYNRTLDFVGLPRHQLGNDKDYHKGHYKPMSDETRKRLEDFFTPFNRKLQEMLEPMGIKISWAEEDLEVAA